MKKNIGEKRFSVRDALDFNLGDHRTLRSDLVDRASNEIEIPDAAIDRWTGEVTIETENSSPYEPEFVVTLYYETYKCDSLCIHFMNKECITNLEEGDEPGLCDQLDKYREIGDVADALNDEALFK